MNTRIGTSFGLALLLALGIIATMLALGMFSSSSKVGAAAVPIDHVVNAAVNSPDTPGELATFTITFQNPTALSAGSGQLYVKFDSLLSVPSTMEKERITISSSGGGTSNPLFDPSITTDEAGDTVVVLTIGDTDPGTAGNQNLAAWNAACCTLATNANNGHVLQFSSLAGIRNSTFPSTAAAWVDMSDDGVTYNTTPRAIPVFRWLSLSAGAAARGTVITLTGKGYASGGTATVFLDDLSVAANRSFLLDSAETVLGTSAAAISGGTFTSSFTVDTNFSVGNNSINAVDSTGVGAAAPNSGARYTSQSMSLFGAISLSASSASRGASITVTLSDFTGVGPVTLLTIGGVPADLSVVTTTTIANNTLSLGVSVPSTTPLGTQTVSVTATTEGVVAGVASARTATLEVTGLTLVASPSTAVAGQAVTVSGSGFSTAGATVAGAIATVTVGGIAQTLLSNGNAVTTVTMDNSGNLVASFGIPNNDVTRTAGTHVLRITDNNNRIGEALITVPSRALTLTPTTSKRSSTVNYTGSGYIASTTVTITYAGTTVDTVTADSGGNISGSFTVPTGSGIPSANAVVAASTCTCSGTLASGGVATQLAGAATHSVPGAVITADPASAASGQIITISGTGFPGFVGLAALTVGGVSALPSPAPATNGDGLFTASALVPELAAGSQSLVATVGTGNTAVTATSSFTVLATAATPTVTTNATEVVFADDIASDNLVRVWLFSNTTKDWTFFDPRPAFAAANSLTDASSGDIVWVNFTADTTFQGTAYTAGWSIISLD